MPQFRRHRSLARRTALITGGLYLAFGVTWILVSDYAALVLVGGDQQRLREVQSLKGIAFVLLSAGVIYGLVVTILAREQASLRAMQESEERFRRVFDSNMIGLFFWDLSGRVYSANSRFLDMLGYSAEDAAAGRLRWDTLTPPEYAPLDAQGRREIVRDGVAKPFEKQFFRADGGRVTVLVGGALIDSAKQTGVGFVLDITRQKEDEARIRRLIDELRRASKLKDEFLATMSHELRTPVTAIKLWSHILDKNLSDPTSVEEASRMIAHSAEQQAALIEDLLDLSRIMINRLPVVRATVDFGSIVESTVSGLKAAADDQGVTLSLDLRVGSVALDGDERRLRQVVTNLVGNAIKFTPAGGTVNVILEGGETTTSLTVRDTGIGMPKSFQPHLFDRFRQADNSTSRRYGGLGIGLPISRYLVEMHGGTIRGQSDGEGKGSTFIVELPLTPGLIVPQPAATSEAAMDRPLAALDIVLVEDDADSRLALHRILTRAGANVQAAAEVAGAEHLIEHLQPDILISDLALPEEDGFSLVRRLRDGKLGCRSNLPAIAVTAFTSEDAEQRCKEAGFDRHIPKPVEIELLVRAILDLTDNDIRKP